MFQVWKGKWNDINIIGKKLAIKMVNKRISRDFSEEYSKLRFVALYFQSKIMRIITINKNGLDLRKIKLMDCVWSQPTVTQLWV